MENILTIDNLHFGFSKDKPLYSNFSLSMKRGEVVAVVGSSGVGKSTLFELIVGNLKPLNGSIEVAKLSQVFQDPYNSFHPSYSLINQIKDVASTDKIEDLLETTRMSMELLEKKPFELSGGQLQRASIVRALLMKPQLLLLDEPTSALDNVIQLEVMQLLVEQLREIGMLFITHDYDLARWSADRIVEIGA